MGICLNIEVGIGRVGGEQAGGCDNGIGNDIARVDRAIVIVKRYPASLRAYNRIIEKINFQCRKARWLWPVIHENRVLTLIRPIVSRPGKYIIVNSCQSSSEILKCASRSI